MPNAKPVKTPINSEVDEIKGTESILVTKSKYPYRDAVGSLKYISNKCRLDNTYAVNVCTRKMENPTETDM